MASGFRNNAGVDFDNLFDPDVQGDGYTATFLRRSDGTPLRYAAAKYGQPGPTVGYRDSGGTDVGPKWAAKGTAHYAAPVPNLAFGDLESIASASHGSGNQTAACSLIVRADGTWIASPASSGAPTGDWYAPATGGIGSGYWVKFSYTIGGGTLGSLVVTNQATGWTQITGDLSIQLGLTFGAGGTASATRFGTVTCQIASDPNGTNIVSQGTTNWRDEVDITA